MALVPVFVDVNLIVKDSLPAVESRFSLTAVRVIPTSVPGSSYSSLNDSPEVYALTNNTPALCDVPRSIL